MQKRSHKLLADVLLENYQGFGARRYELAFLFGSFEPDCNPLTYLKGSLHGRKLQGHCYPNSWPYVESRIRRLQQRRRDRWNLWHYYTLGKLSGPPNSIRCTGAWDPPPRQGPGHRRVLSKKEKFRLYPQDRMWYTIL